MSQWVATVPIEGARQYLLLLLQGKAKQAEREIKQRYAMDQRASSSPTPAKSQPQRRSLAELRIIAEHARAKRLERKQQQKRRELEKQRQQRERYLATLAEDFAQHWRQVDDLVAQQIASAYDRARDLLVDFTPSYTNATSSRRNSHNFARSTPAVARSYVDLIKRASQRGRN
jgi:hypothetical protein